LKFKLDENLGGTAKRFSPPQDMMFQLSGSNSFKASPMTN